VLRTVRFDVAVAEGQVGERRVLHDGPGQVERAVVAETVPGQVQTLDRYLDVVDSNIVRIGHQRVCDVLRTVRFDVAVAEGQVGERRVLHDGPGQVERAVVAEMVPGQVQTLDRSVAGEAR